MIAAAVELLQQLAHAADRTGLNAISKQPKAVVVGHLGIGGQRLVLVCPCLAFIDALARGERMIEHNSKLTFPMLSLSSFVRGTETPALAFTETTDTLGLFCWLFKDQLLAKINTGLDVAAAGDKAALSQQQREQMEAQISSDMLAIERAEVACIWHAEAQNNEILDFRVDTRRKACSGLGWSIDRAPARRGLRRSMRSISSACGDEHRSCCRGVAACTPRSTGAGLV